MTRGLVSRTILVPDGSMSRNMAEADRALLATREFPRVLWWSSSRMIGLVTIKHTSYSRHGDQSN